MSFGEINGIMQESGNHSHSFIEGVVNYIDKCCNISFVSDRLGSIVIEAENELAVNNLFKKHKIKPPFSNHNSNA